MISALASFRILFAAWARLAIQSCISYLSLQLSETVKPSITFLYQLSRADSNPLVKDRYLFLLAYRQLWKKNSRYSQLFNRFSSTLGYTNNPLSIIYESVSTSESRDFFFGYFHQNFGHLSLIDVYAKAKKLGFDDKRYVFLRSPSGTSNDSYLDLISNCYDIPCIFLDSHSFTYLNSKYLRSNQLADPFCFQFSAFGQLGLYEGWNLVLDQWSQQDMPSLIDIPQELIRETQEELTIYGVDVAKPFVTLHTRHTPRGPADRRGADTSIVSYEPALRYLIESGYNVIRIGNPEPHMLEIQGFYDLGRVTHDPFIDIYLLAKAKFMIGCGSGPLSVPPTFNVPVLYVNAPCMGHMPRFSRSRFIPQNIYSSATNKKLTYVEVLRSPLAFTTAPSIAGLSRIPSSSEDILDAVIEFNQMVCSHNFPILGLHGLQMSLLKEALPSDTAGMLISSSFYYNNPWYLN